MMTGRRPAKPVLVFNRRKILTLIAASVYEAAKYGNIKPGNISKTCTGKSISNSMYYFRYIDENVEVGMEDIGTLELEEYDQLCGITRAVYATPNMNRKNWKYKRKTK